MKKILDALNIYDPNVWIEDGRWVQPPLVVMFFTYWYDTDVVKRIVPGLKLHTIFSIDGYAFHHKESRRELRAYIEERYKEDSLKKFVDKIDAEGSALSKRFLKELENDDAYIERNIERIIDTYIEITGFWVLTALLGDEITRLAKEVRYVFSEADLFAKVQPYLRDTWLEEESRDVRAIAEKYIAAHPDQDISGISSVVEGDEELSGLLEAYSKKFSWSRISKWVGESLDREYALKRLKEEVTNLQQGNHLKTLHKSQSDRGFDGVVALCVCSAYWRAESAKNEMLMSYRMRSVLESVASKNGCDYRQVLLLTPKELIGAIEDPDKTIKDKETVFSRAGVFFNTLSEDGQEIILIPRDSEFAEIDSLYLKKQYAENEKPEVLTGVGASRGQARGRVRVIDSSAQFDTFQDGEILVAAETSPTFVPLMRASSAILTGKGGITSHAAIVSRELGKPCIIAVKDITRILKTGDCVEIDADKGIIKILK